MFEAVRITIKIQYSRGNNIVKHALVVRSSYREYDNITTVTVIKLVEIL